MSEWKVYNTICDYCQSSSLAAEIVTKDSKVISDICEKCLWLAMEKIGEAKDRERQQAL